MGDGGDQRSRIDELRQPSTGFYTTSLASSTMAVPAIPLVTARAVLAISFRCLYLCNHFRLDGDPPRPKMRLAMIMGANGNNVAHAVGASLGGDRRGPFWRNKRGA
jgi:hypothetical protein